MQTAQDKHRKKKKKLKLEIQNLRKQLVDARSQSNLQSSQGIKEGDDNFLAVAIADLR